MVTRVETYLVDDLDGSTAVQTVQFSLQGIDYEIDLNQKNLDEMYEAIGRYANSARKVTDRRRSAGAQPRRVATSNTKEIRAWAEVNGVKVNPRGRLKASVTAAYKQAQARTSSLAVKQN